MVAWASLHFPSSELHPIASKITPTGFRILPRMALPAMPAWFRRKSSAAARNQTLVDRKSRVLMRMAKRESLLRPTMEKLSFTVQEAAALSSLGQTSIYKAIKERRLRIRKYGTRTIITRSDLASFLENLPDETERPER
jgi:excisionase family DNA binding protein